MHEGAVEEGRDLVGRREFLDLSLKLNDSLGEGLRLRSDLGKVEDDVAKVISDMDNMMRKSDIGSFIEDFGAAAQTFGFLILDGHPLEAAAAYAEIYDHARKSVFVVDNYVGVRTLELLGNVRSGVSVVLFTDNRGRRLHASDVRAFRAEQPDVRLEVRPAGGIFHNRYIVLDYGFPTERLFHCGTSSKGAGERATTIDEIPERDAYHPLIERLLEQPPLELA